MRKVLFLFMAAAMSFACGKPAALPEKEMCLQLYSIREIIGSPEQYAANHEAVFASLAQMGFTSVEAASYADGKFYGVSPEQYKADVEAAGLKPLSSHATRNLSSEEAAAHDFTAALEWWKEAIAAHKAAGMEYIVTPWSDVPATLAELQTRCEFFNEVGRLCKEAGLSYGYHSHSHEYAEVEGVKMLDYMIEHTDADKMFFQMDVYWRSEEPHV